MTDYGLLAALVSAAMGLCFWAALPLSITIAVAGSVALLAILEPGLFHDTKET